MAGTPSAPVSTESLPYTVAGRKSLSVNMSELRGYIPVFLNPAAAFSYENARWNALEKHCDRS